MLGGRRAVFRGEYWEGVGQYLEGNIGRMGGRRAVFRGEYWEGKGQYLEGNIGRA